MQRRLDDLTGRTFDLVVIGGGIAGAAAACDAARRGLKVALLERADFAAASSSSLFKLAHGGLRYLQHADLVRLRQSARARNHLLTLAPHLVRPLDIVVPTSGFGLSGRPALRAALWIYDLATADLRRMIDDPAQAVPLGRIWGKDELRAAYPFLAADEFSGAGVFTEGLITAPARVVLGFVEAAFEAGAVIANRVEVTGFDLDQGRVRAVAALDRLSGERLSIETRLVLDASGPYAPGLSIGRLSAGKAPPIPFSRDAWFVVGKRLVEGDAAVALTARSHDPDALVSRGKRHLFLVPWRGRTLVGVWHKVYRGLPDDYRVHDEEVAGWVQEITEAAPGLGIRLDDIELVQAGLLPFGENANTGAAGDNLRYGHRSHFVDHSGTGAAGCASLVAVRFTTAPLEAVRAVDRLARQLDRKIEPTRLTEAPLPGGDIDDRDGLVRAIEARGFPLDLARGLVDRHGSRASGLVERAASRPELGVALPGTDTLGIEVVVALEQEMAQDLADILFRRTETLTAGAVSTEALTRAAVIAGAVAGWGERRQQAEIERVAGLLAERRSGRALLGRPFATVETGSPADASADPSPTVDVDGAGT